MKRISLLFAVVTLCLIGETAKAAISCKDVEMLDRAENLGGALEFMFRCQPISAQELENNWAKFPDAAKALFTAYFLVPGTSLIPATDGRLLELIGDGSGIFQRLLAFEYRYDTPEITLLWKNSISQLVRETSELERLYYTASQYAESDGMTEAWSLSPARLTLELANTNVPYFQVEYARLMILGQLVTGSEDEFLSIYERHVRNDPTAAWLKASYLEAKIWEGEISYRRFSEEIIDLYKTAMDSGLHAAMRSMAEVLNFGVIVEGDSSEAMRLYQILAQYGWPDAQVAFGDGLISGNGISQNELVGWDWIEMAASQGYAVAYDRFFEKALEEADFAEALFWAMRNAEAGYVSFADKGYVAARALLSNLQLSKASESKLIDYLRFHCGTNISVSDRGECESLGKDVKTFRSRPSLTEAAENPSILRLLDEFQLDTGRYVALVVSNDEYEFWDSLETPRSDAQLIGSILETEYGFEVSYLNNATRRDTLKAIYEIGSNLQFHDHFLLYYAGHGVVDRVTDTAYWIPSNASRDFRPDWISSSEIMTSLKSIPSRHLLLVADSCYSGKLLRGAAPTEGNPGVAVIQRLFSKKARVAITSGGDEPVQDASSGGENSVFAIAFADALRNAGGPTPSSTIFNDVLGAVSLEASQTPQYADMRELGHDGGDFIFVPDTGQ